jgi:transaldolase
MTTTTRPQPGQDAPDDALVTPLQRMVRETASDFWNDSCAAAELEYAIANGASGATSNPSIVLEVLRKEPDHWLPRLADLIASHPTWTEVDLTWALIDEMAVRGAEILSPVARATGGRLGRISAQTDPSAYRDPARMLAQAIHFDGLAPNMQVKFPTTSAGLVAMEEATARGIAVNATVCTSVPQAIAVAEALERGLDRRAADGHDISGLAPVVTIMVGRLDDWLRVVVERDGLAIHPDALDWAGIAVFKRACAIFAERGYRGRPLAAAYRHRLHWTELIGGDIVMTMTHAWQVRFNESGLDPVPRFSEPVDAALVAELLAWLPDFRRAYEPDGMTVAEFDTFGPTVRTLRTFIASYHDLQAAVREVMLPDPDVRRSS